MQHKEVIVILFYNLWVMGGWGVGVLFVAFILVFLGDFNHPLLILPVQFVMFPGRMLSSAPL